MSHVSNWRSEFKGLGQDHDILPIVWCGGEDFARLGGDNAAVYIEASNLNRKRVK